MFILGYPIIVITDHKALIFLFRCRLRNAWLPRWTLTLQEFDLRIQHIEGSKNIIDVLSRHPVDRDKFLSQTKSPCICETTPRNLAAYHQTQIESFQKIFQEQRMDTNLCQTIDVLNSNLAIPTTIDERYCLYQNILFYRRYPMSDT